MLSIAMGTSVPPSFSHARRSLCESAVAESRFDTGFVCHQRGWDSIPADDRGMLWDHLVLDTLQTSFDRSMIRYWRDKSQREVDFVVQAGFDEVDVYECKMSLAEFSGKSLSVFRSLYPHG